MKKLNFLRKKVIGEPKTVKRYQNIYKEICSKKSRSDGDIKIFITKRRTAPKTAITVNPGVNIAEN